jgi:PAS domain S-box-containing protein
MTLRILIADDHDIVRRGLKSLLRTRADWDVCGEAADGKEAVDKAKQLKPDVVVLDVSMPNLNGLDAARRIRREVPGSEILILSQHESREMVNEAVRAGALGYVVKSDISRDLLSAIEAVSQHRPLFSSKIGQLHEPATYNADRPALAARVQNPPVNPATAWAGGVNEVHDTRALNQSLRENEERLRIALEASETGTFRWDPGKEHFLDFGNGLKRIVGVPQEEPVKATEDFLRRIHPDDVSRVREALLACKQGKDLEIEHRVVWPDGTVRWLYDRGKLVSDGAGHTAYLVGACTDITRRKKAEQALQEAHDLLDVRVRERTEELERKTTQVLEQARLLDLANDAIFIRSLDGTIFYWNDGAERLYGWSKQEVPFQPLSILLRTEFPIPFEEIKNILFREGRWEGELIHTRRDGTRVNVASRWTVWRNAEGVPVGWLQINTDVTEQRRIEDGLRAMSARLLHLQDEERRRIARELHDSAGQLLVGLKLNLELLGKTAGTLPDAASKALDDSVQLVDELSRELRTISHLLHPPLLDEAGLCSAIRWYVEGFSNRSNIAVDLELSADLGRMPREMETAVFRIVQECLTNIHRHSASPTARIQLSREDHTITLEVSDQGKGLPVDLRTAFGPVRPGVGIQGMHERVRQLGGKLELLSEGTGTTIRASLPVESAAAQGAGQEQVS